MNRVHMPHVDVMVCTACQLRCVGCTNFMGVLPMKIWAYEDIVRDVDQAAGAMFADLACILGGEPTSHPRLVDLIRAVKHSGLAGKVQVLTNGMRLGRMVPEFWTEIDRLKISVYPGKTPAANVELAIRMQAEHGFELDYKHVEHDPFRAVLTREPRDDADAQATYDRCWYRTFTRKIERGHFFRCCTSPSISETVLGLPLDHDGIPLAGLTAETLQAFLDRPTFMASCTRCFGNSGPQIGWSEQRDQATWMDHSMVAA